MKIKLNARDKQVTWHGGQIYTLTFSMECANMETRDRVWTAIEKALPAPETKSEKSSAIGFETGHD
jgi:hypothetical protein